MEKQILIGSHVAMNAPDYFLGAVEEAISYKANTFMFYTGAPQNLIRKDLKDLKIAEGLHLAKENGIDETKLIVHAPYIINPANASRSDIIETTKEVLINELRRTAAFNVKTLVLHPGSHVGLGEEVGLNSLVEVLNEVLSIDNTDVKIAIETMAGKGKEIGISFEQIKKVIDSCKFKNRLGVCLDTCHISDAGYDLNDIDKLLSHFDEVIGLDRLLCIHVNDSKNPNGAHKDRHENIGYGFIGFEPLYNIVHHPLLINVPKILETPYIDEKPPYLKEIDMLRSGKFIKDWKDSF